MNNLIESVGLSACLSGKERRVWKIFIFPTGRREISQDRDMEYIKDEERRGVEDFYFPNRQERDQSGQRSEIH